MKRIDRYLLAIIAVVFLASPTARAHEVRPAYLEINETASGQYSILWRTPVLSGMRLPVRLKLPDDLRNLKDPVVQDLTDSLVERHWVDAGPQGLAGRRIEFVGLQLTITDVLVRMKTLDGQDSTALIRPPQPWFEPAAASSKLQVAGTYMRLGVEHILTGVDHLLFILALIVITCGGWKLVKTITAFTVSHTITLTAATLGFVHVPQAPVEAVIALSIVFVACEIIRKYQGRPGLTERWPWIVALTFGLLHGLGFAGALSEVGLPAGHIPLALLFFSIGVELGQLLFIAAVFTVVALARRIARSFAVPHPAWAWRLPPYAIGSVAMFWVIQRIAAFAP